jgi:hypothetical protein
MAILKNLKQEQENELAKLRAEVERLKRDRQATMKVSAKKGVSVYGLGRWPVTLYKGQWETLLEMKNDILDFISEHESELATKDSNED